MTGVQTTGHGRQDDYLGPVNPSWGLFLISVLGLFLEMLLIRWISTEVRIFAYMQNTILVVCFLGLGLGCFTCRQPVKLREGLLALFILTGLIAIPWTRQGFGKISAMLSILGDLVIWHQTVSSDPAEAIFFVLFGLLLTYCLMLLILDIFVPLGRILGRLMDDHPYTIWAYSVNVAGSLAGTWLFVLFSMLFLPPVAWFLLLAFLLSFFVDWRSTSRLTLALIPGLVLLGWLAGQEFGALKVVWSPYQKLVLWSSSHFPRGVGQYTVTVNNTGYQAMIDLSQGAVGSPDSSPSSGAPPFSQYDLPFLFHPHPRSCLIVGAGTGNDAAGALRHRLKEVVAVEIDPAIIALGQDFHPEKPYASRQVQVVLDDARSYFALSREKFDVIIFGLLDSHTTTSMTNARLDHYVYTRESLARAKELLAEGGIMVLSFEAQKHFIADRMATVLHEVFQQEPLSFRVPFSNAGWGGVLFIAGNLSAARTQIARTPRLAAFIEEMQQKFPLRLAYATRITTDDWPYIYLDRPRIPLLYFLLGGLMALLLARSYRHWQAQGVVARWRRAHWHFFFLGAAFLLLEVQNISKAAVVLGNTWEVNAVIVSGVLVMILLANLVAYRFPRLPLGWVYALLIGSCLGLYFVDLARFAFLPYLPKAALVGGLTTLPMLFSGVVFIRSFAAFPGKDEALGANLMGALVGALLQSVTFITGIRALLLIVAAFYVLSLLTRPALTTERAA
jgi:predicted RNA methylase